MSVNKVNSDGSLTRIAGGTLYADAPIGSILAYGGSSAPSGWLMCQGQAVSRMTYAELFSAIGTAFGSGDGSSTFNLPDAREASLVGSGQNTLNTIATHDVYSVGEFKDDQLQSHTHTVTANNNYKIHWTGSADVDVGKITTETTSVPSGRTGDTTHGKQLGVNYIIKAKQTAVPFDVAEYVKNNIYAEQTVTGTTTPSGNIAISLSRKDTALAVLPADGSTQYIITPWYDPNGKTWYAHFTDGAGASVGSGITATVTVRYIAG